MMGTKLLSLLLMIVICDQILCEEGYFIVTANSLLKAGKTFKGSVSYQGYANEKVLQISLKDKGEDKEELFAQKNVSFTGSGIENFEFDLKNIPEGDYVLEVKSVTGDKFESLKKLHWNKKLNSIFIQTDKSIYKPSDNIQFRVIAVNAETLPLDPAKAEIYITDGADNRVKQFEKVHFKKGVYQNELQLSDLPVMGTWKIHVKINEDEEVVKSFDVAEYVLPKFEVFLDANPDANYKDGVVRATVRAKYTFGKIAKGNATVTAEIESWNWWRRNGNNNKKVSKTVEVDGKKFVEFDLEKDLEMTEKSYERKILLSTTFTDELSGKEANATAKVTVHTTRHKIEMKKSDDKFKPGLPFKVTASVQFYDHNMPVTDKHNPLKFTITYFYDIMRKCKRRHNYYHFRRPIELKSNDEGAEEVDQETTTEKVEEYDCREEKSFNEEKEIFLTNGQAEIDIVMPSNTTHLNVKAKYLETEDQLYYIQRAQSDSGEYIQTKVITEKPSLNDPVLIELLSTHDISEYNYQIFAKGSLVAAMTASTEKSKRNVLSIIPKSSMLPKAKIIVFYIASNGEIVSDNVEVEFGNELVNFVDIKLSSQQAKPGETLNISVLSKPNSFVGLLGVDQSVLLLKKGNDIDQSLVFAELDKYGEIDKYNYRWYDNYDYDSYHRDFNEVDAIIITNVKKETNRDYIPMYYDYSEGGGVGLSLADHSDGRLLQKTAFRTTSLHLGVYHSMAMPALAAAPGPIMQESAFNRGDAAIADLDRNIITSTFSTGGASPSRQSKPIEIRTEFPETWLFDNLEFGANENTPKVLSKKVPDTITSWIITGFSMDPLTGLGLTKQPSKFNVFQPFFVSTNLPYSIKRGEVVAIPIIVFNYLENDQTAEVTLFNTDREFEFVEIDESENSLHRKKRSLDAQRKKTVLIKSNDGTSVSFMIRPLKVGHITIKVTAESQMAGDGVEKQLKVEPEGVTQFMNDAVFIDLRNTQNFNKNIDIVVPNNAVPDSTRIEASAVGDILGPSIENLDKLIKLPYGCGEQNMLNFVPNIVVLDYLTNLNKLNPTIEQKAKKYMESGYQRELTYKHDDGSYSAFGKSDKSGSTWLTAFVAKSFHQASKYILVDKAIVKEALDFLKDVQTSNGSFPEVGHVSHKDMQGGSSKGIALTAYTLITFLENKDLISEYQTTINKAIEYIINNFALLEDNYSLAIATYALQLAKHESKDSFLDKLKSKSENKDGMKYWNKEQPASNETNPWMYRPNSVNVEMSAYALQAFIEAGLDTESVPIMKWLVTQRNENGGFQSTQDTVVGLQALSKLATKIYVPSSEIQINVKSPDANPKTININSANSLILQKHELSPDARHFEVSASGRGFSILQISYRYNIDDSGKYPRFTLDPKIGEASNKEFLHLTVCTKFVPDSQAEKSNMAVMEVTLPSGFTFDSDHHNDLLATERVKKVETKDGETIVIIYFDDIDASSLCPEIKAYRTHGVAKQKPSPIVIYDYYDNSRHARTFYNPPEISLCDICLDEAECKDACEVEGIETD